MTTQVIPALALTQKAPLLLQRFDKYILLRKLAEGGMAEIFLAKQVGAEGFEREVVIKCMLSQLGSSREFVNMFLDEARVAAKLFHPNIVQILDLGIADGRYFICMEYLAGEDLENISAKLREQGQPIPLAIATKLIGSACEGLEFAHHHQENGRPVNLVHRDVSPSNILVTFQGTVKVVDFGIAKASSKLTLTQPGMLKGKLGYMSPEQARGLGLDARSDIFSLGVTFWELLTGRRLFERDNELGVLLAIMDQPIPPPSQIRPEVPEVLDQLILKMLARHPEGRHDNTSLLRAELEAVLATLSTPTTTQVSAWMTQLFGVERVQRKTQIPTLQELQGQGQVSPVPSASPLPDPLGAPVGPTLVRQEAFVPPPALPRKTWAWAMVAGTLVLGAGGLFGLFQPAVVPVVHDAVPLPVPARPAPVPQERLPPPTAERTEEALPAPSTHAPSKKSPPLPVLTSQDVMKVLQRHQSKIIACGQTHLPQLPPDGVVTVLFSVSRAGVVNEAKTTTPGLAGKALDRCLVSHLRVLRFPKNSNRPELVIEQPLRFRGQISP